MYAILSGGALVALCDRPRYVKFNKTSGAYVETDAENAEGIAVRGSLYNINGRKAIPGAPEAVIAGADAAEYLFSSHKRALENGDAVAGVEDALCGLDMTAGEKLAALEDALCELDNITSRGGGN